MVPIENQALFGILTFLLYCGNSDEWEDQQYGQCGNSDEKLSWDQKQYFG